MRLSEQLQGLEKIGRVNPHEAVLSQAHKLRNRSEYDGDPIDVTHGLVDDLVSAVANVQEEAMLLFKAFKHTPQSS